MHIGLQWNLFFPPPLRMQTTTSLTIKLSMLRVAHGQCSPSQIWSPCWHDVHLASRIVFPLSLCPFVPIFFVGPLSHHFWTKKLQIVMCKQYTKSTLLNNFKTSFPQNEKCIIISPNVGKTPNLAWAHSFSIIIIIIIMKSFFYISTKNSNRKFIYVGTPSSNTFLPFPSPTTPPFFPLFLILRRGRGLGEGEVDLGWVMHVFIVWEKNQRKHMKNSPWQGFCI